MTMSCSARNAGRMSRCWPWYVYACARARRGAVSGAALPCSHGPNTAVPLPRS